MQVPWFIDWYLLFLLVYSHTLLWTSGDTHELGAENKSENKQREKVDEYLQCIYMDDTNTLHKE